MTIKINKILFDKIIIILIVFLECGMFYLPVIPDLVLNNNTYQKKTLMAGIIIIICAIKLIQNKLRIKKSDFSNLILVYGVILLLEIGYSWFSYEQKIESLIPIIAPYICILGYFVFRDVYLKDGDYDFIIDVVIISSTVLAIILVISSFIYNTTGKFVLNIIDYDFSSYVPQRNGRLRLYSGNTIIPLSMILSLCEMKYREKRKIALLNIIAGWIYLIYLAQTRGLTLVVLFTFLLTFLVSSEIKNIYKIVGIIIFGMFFLVMQWNMISIFSFESDEISVTYRLYALKHFSEIIFQKPFTGNGFINEYTNPRYFSLVHGTLKNAYYSDVGIIGTVAKFGLLLGGWYLIYLYKLFISAKDNFIALGLLIYGIYSSFTFSYFDPQRILIIPLTLCVVEAENIKKMKNTNK